MVQNKLSGANYLYLEKYTSTNAINTTILSLLGLHVVINTITIKLRVLLKKKILP